MQALFCACRNNTSDYYVNNKRMNVKEVTTLLKSKGIDLDNNRFLILQVSKSSPDSQYLHRCSSSGGVDQAPKG